MGHIKSLAIVIGTGCLIGACSFSTDAWWPLLTDEFSADALWPPLSGEELSVKSEKHMDESTSQTGAVLELGTTNFVSSRVTPGQSTGTFIGQITLGTFNLGQSGDNAYLARYNPQAGEYLWAIPFITGTSFPQASQT